MMSLVGGIDRDLVYGFRKLSHKGKIRQVKSPIKDDYRHHTDGWGIGYFRDGVPYLYKEGTDAFYSYGYEMIARELHSYPPEATVFHVRRASDKSTISDAKAHPFGGSVFNKDFVFCHNGSITKYSSEPFRGMTDSEVIFDLLLEGMKSTDMDGVLAAIQYLRNKIEVNKKEYGWEGYASLNFLLCDGKHVFAYRDCANPADEEYYTLFYGKFEEGYVVASEEFDKRIQWTPIKNGELLHITKDKTDSRMVDMIIAPASKEQPVPTSAPAKSHNSNAN
jgi:predicted glutamine amidotransferase